MLRNRPAVLCLAVALTWTLTGCDDGDDSASGTPTQPVAAGEQQGDAKPAPTLADGGPGVCFELLAKHLGDDTEVNEVSSSFSAGEEIKPQLVDPDKTPPAGELTHCSANYRDPEDDKKLVQTTLDIDTGEFSAPVPLEITVMGDAATFDLDDHVIALSKVDPEPLRALMERRQGDLDGAFSKHAWTGLTLQAPDTWSPDHTLRLDVTGRVAGNDVVESGYLELSADGTSVSKDNLLP